MVKTDDSDNSKVIFSQSLYLIYFRKILNEFRESIQNFGWIWTLLVNYLLVQLVSLTCVWKRRLLAKKKKVALRVSEMGDDCKSGDRVRIMVGLHIHGRVIVMGLGSGQRHIRVRKEEKDLNRIRMPFLN